MLVKPGYKIRVKTNFVKNGEKGEIYRYLIEERESDQKQTIIEESYTKKAYFSRVIDVIETVEAIVYKTKRSIEIDLDQLIEMIKEDNREKRYELFDTWMETIDYVDKPIKLKKVTLDTFSGKLFSPDYTCVFFLYFDTITRVSTEKMYANYSLTNDIFSFGYSGYMAKKEIEKLQMLMLENDEIQEYIKQAKNQLKEDRQHRVKALLLGMKLEK